MIYTVFGIYPDNLQRHVQSLNADDPDDAEVKYRLLTSEDTLIAAVVIGEVDTVDLKIHADE